MSVKDTILSIILFVIALALSPFVLGVMLFGFIVYAIVMTVFAGIMLICALVDYIEAKAHKS